MIVKMFANCSVLYRPRYWSAPVLDRSCLKRKRALPFAMGFAATWGTAGSVAVVVVVVAIAGEYTQDSGGGGTKKRGERDGRTLDETVDSFTFFTMSVF